MEEIANKEKEFIKLGWRILECKLLYYLPELVDPVMLRKYSVSDLVYDSMEDEYKKLAVELNHIPTVTNMVDFDLTRASCRLVLNKFRKA